MTLDEEIEQYGKVVYRKGEDLPNQIYVVAQSHNNPDGSFNENIPMVQLEIFRIGQNLTKNYEVFLILPESRNKETDYYLSEDKQLREILCENFFRWHHERTKNDKDVIHLLEEGLSDNIRGATLLACEPNVVMQGAESKLAHELALHAIYNNQTYGLQFLSRLREINLLFNIPKVTSREFNLGRVPNLNSMVTFGGGHMDKMRYAIDNDGFGISLMNGYNFLPLNYQKQGYGVTIIMPHHAY